MDYLLPSESVEFTMVPTSVDWLPRPPGLPRKSQPLQDGAHEIMVCIAKVIVLFSIYKSIGGLFNAAIPTQSEEKELQFRGT